jgi:hypothetical protein
VAVFYLKCSNCFSDPEMRKHIKQIAYMHPVTHEVILRGYAEFGIKSLRDWENLLPRSAMVKCTDGSICGISSIYRLARNSSPCVKPTIFRAAQSVTPCGAWRDAEGIPMLDSDLERCAL